MNLSGKTLLVRTDASEVIGAGHVMRCLALSQVWRDLGGRVIFACCSLPAVFENRLRAEKMEVQFMEGETGSPEDARQFTAIAARETATAIVVDFYQAKVLYLRSLRDPRWKILCIDDNAELPSYPVDFVLNQNVHANTSLYSMKRENSGLMLGPDYALLRNEFTAYRDWQRDNSRAPQNLLISMGGGDQTPTLLKLIVRLKNTLRPLKLTVVLARPYGETPSLEKLMKESDLDFNISIAPVNMARELERHDLLLSSGGATVWEALYMQIPAVFVVIAPNQAPSCMALEKISSYRTIPSADEVSESSLIELVGDSALRSKLAQEGRSLVDGRGPERVIEMLCA